jgi:hypothetical protein
VENDIIERITAIAAFSPKFPLWEWSYSSLLELRLTIGALARPKTPLDEGFTWRILAGIPQCSMKLLIQTVG